MHVIDQVGINRILLLFFSVCLCWQRTKSLSDFVLWIISLVLQLLFC